MNRLKSILSILAAAAALALPVCGQASAMEPAIDMDGSAFTAMEHMAHADSGELPKGMKPAVKPAFPVGSHAILLSEHMEGMKGAEATITGAYDTIVYAVSYVPTTGGKRVTNHKWVVQEEIRSSGNELLKPGTTVTLEAGHMPGMKGAQATIESAERTTAYRVDYVPTTGGHPVTNHMWVVESELSPRK